MAATDIAAWLRGLGLDRYVEVFRANDVDADILPELSDADLEKLGVSLGHRKKLLKAIAELRAGDGEQPGPPLPVCPKATPEIAGERRQVTVLFADLSGYTELSRQLDAEEVHELLERFFERVDEVIDQLGGSVDKHIGDCVMAVFGAPTAHGNDAERAARAALAIRDAMPGLGEELGHVLEVHIGLAAGQVVASRSGSATHREYTVTGDSVNLASRLTDEAAPGTILISDLVRRMLPPTFICGDAGTLAVKGLAEAVRAFRLLGIGTAAAERPPFVGRRAELAQFQGALSACRATDAGQAVVVRGEAGIGKTRVLEEVQALAKAAGFVCHTALVLDFGAGSGQDAIRALVRSLLDLTTSSIPAALQSAAERALGDGLVASEQRVYLNDLLDLPQPTALRALYDAMDNATRNHGKRATVASLVRSLSERQPLLLVVEDVHWADRLTLEHLATLTETVAACPALLVMTSRIDGDPLDHAWRSSIAGSPLMTIDLGPLRPQEATAFAGAYLDATAAFAQRCIERAAGNPLFLEQLLRHAKFELGGRRARLSAKLGPGPHGSVGFRRQAGPSGGLDLWPALHARRAPSCGRASRLRLRWSGAALSSPAGRRRLSVRPRPDPGRGLRFAAPRKTSQLPSAGGGMVRGTRPNTARRAPRSGRRSCGAARLSRGCPRPGRRLSVTSAPAG